MINHFTTYIGVMEDHFEQAYKGTPDEEHAKRWIEKLKKHKISERLEALDWDEMGNE